MNPFVDISLLIHAPGLIDRLREIVRRQPVASPNGDLVSEEWRPTRRQFERYAAREVELARRNIALVRDRTDGSVGGLHDATLHSKRTIRTAMKAARIV